MRGRPKPFSDKLDEWLETATEQEVRDALGSIRIWCRWKKLGFTVEVKPVKEAA